MSKYKIKSIFDNTILIEYRTENGTLKNINVGILPGWDKSRIEKEIALQKQAEDNKDIKLDISQYFSKGEELEFISIPSEEERIEIMNEEFEKQQQLMREEENKKFLEKVIEYRNKEVDYIQVRWYSYPSIEEQLDALYWMRQGIMEPIQEVDKKISEVKKRYPKDEPTNLTCADLDNMFPDQRPSEYLNELRLRNILTDFL